MWLAARFALMIQFGSRLGICKGCREICQCNDFTIDPRWSFVDDIHVCLYVNASISLDANVAKTFRASDTGVLSDSFNRGIAPIFGGAAVLLTCAQFDCCTN